MCLIVALSMLHKHLESARAVALSAPGVGKSKFRVGAVLVHRRHGIIAAKCNSYKTHPALARFTKWPHLHAEAAVVLAAGFDAAEDCDVYVARVMRGGGVGMAKPCSEICQPIMREAGVRRVWYTTDGGVEVMEF